jgi:hypothetical protein
MSERDDDEHPCQLQGIELEDGDEVLFNDRSRPLTVDGSHQRQRTTRMWRQRGGSKYHTVVELTGNGTTYHLLCTPYSEHGPMLYQEADWDDETDELGQSPVYSRSGERVTEMEVL